MTKTETLHDIVDAVRDTLHDSPDDATQDMVVDFVMELLELDDYWTTVVDVIVAKTMD